MKCAKLGWLIVVALLPALALAETQYVTDQVTVPLRADATPAGAVVKTVSTGAALEILERGAGVVHVRDAQGAEGWIDASALSAQPPAGGQVKSLRAELERTRAQLVQVQTQLDKSRAASATGQVPAQLQADLDATRNQLNQLQDELKKKDGQLAALSAAPKTDLITPAGESKSGLGLAIWLVIAFAMLVLGFIGGMVWVRESIRRRMGGLYLRI